MKTVNIKGKEYVEVNERVKHFVANYKGWSIETELLSNEGGVCVFKAIVKDDTGVIKATGHAYEREDSTYINKTSYIENCETSAVGRALGFLGIGIDTSIASSDEVTNAINNQPKTSNGLDFNELREKYSKMTTDELRKEYVAVKTYQGWSDKQKEAVCKIIKQAQEAK
jgi:hypothetical protein